MTTATTSYALDTALERLHLAAYEYGGGLSNHGPMVVEALDHLGLATEIGPWLDRYATHLDPARPTPPGDGAPTLGVDEPEVWERVFAEEVAAHPWPDVVRRWVPILGPGSVGAAGHGALRAAHAVRGLTRDDTDVRRRELVHGLAYWASRFHRLPGLASAGTRTPAEALPDVPATDAGGAWFISERMERVDPADFGPAVAAAALPVVPDDALSVVIDLALRVLATNPAGAIAFVHGVTVPCAMRTLLPFVDDADRRDLAAQAWWVVAALWSTYGTIDPLDDVALRSAAPPAWPDLVRRALASGDEHDIKLCVAAHDQVGRVDDVLLRHVVDVVLG